MSGYVTITVEGFFTERFINSCFASDIIVSNLKREKSTYLSMKIRVQDFKKIRKIAKNTKCKVRITKKSGIPILISKYKKRKIFIALVVLFAIFIFILTRFIWNIDIIGAENINKDEILSLLAENGIEVGKLKNNLEIEKTINKIRMAREDISWIGIDIKGTNIIVKLNEADELPEVIDVNEVCNIVADKAGEISKIIVQQGTAKVAVGDTVEVGDMLVEGIMEGKYTGVREVHAMADIEIKKYAEKEKKENLVQDIEVKTGNEEKKIEIKLNKFKINFNKGVSKFKKYDTMVTTKKLKIFSNYYLPIEILKITNFETRQEHREYTVSELTEKLKLELEQELNEEIGIEDTTDIEENIEVEEEGQTLIVKLVYTLYEKIRHKRN
jgi:similar to stage IV sporulation protein